ncbi:MAG: putative toxin-antitoxin system toxin component, PIN family [Calditrichaceae bacterium]|nr:putative toxin-antitoxin system toxin component, PIN family [Calditrichaceae bacterium]
MIRIVLDTTTVISALFWKGNPRKILDGVRSAQYQLLSSSDIEKELVRVLSYPKFGLTPIEILPIINEYRAYALNVRISSSIDLITEDPTDNIFLECAKDGNANYVILYAVTNETFLRRRTLALIRFSHAEAWQSKITSLQ